MGQTLILALVFLVISAVFSMLGMGGGILYVPILLFAGYDMTQAPGISLILIVATSLAALSNFWKNSKVDWKLALVIDPPTDIMAFVGGYFSSFLPAGLLQSILAAVLMVAGTLMLRNGKTSVTPGTRQRRWWLWNREFDGRHYTVNLPLVLTVTATVGVLSGMLGITGGIIKLPVMVLLCGVPMDIAVATSTVMVAVTGLSGLAGHALHGSVDLHTGALLAVAAVIGGLVGSRISIKMNRGRLKRWFGAIVWLIALRMVFMIIKGS